MGFIGNKPSAVPLTGSDLADNIITSAKIVDGTIASVDLATGVGNDVAKNASQDSNIALLGFLRSTDHATSVLNMQNGFIDQFEDQTGVDDDNSTDALYNVSTDFYGPATAAGAIKNSTMTSDSAPSGTSSASTVLTTNSAFKSFAADGGTSFWATNSVTTGWLQYAFDNGLSAEIVDKYSIESRSVTNEAPKDWTLEGSNTGSFSGEETVLDTQTGQVFSSAEIKTYTFINATAYVYYRLDVTLNNGSTLVSIAEMVLSKTATPPNMTLIAEPQTALTAPDSAHVSLFNQEVDTLTINTDILAWVSRSKQTFTTDFATDNKLDATTHGLLDTGRVMVVTTGDTIPMVRFDGVNDKLQATDGTLGQSDGKSFIWSCWVLKFEDDASSEMSMFGNTSNRFVVKFGLTHKVVVLLRDSAGGTVGSVLSTNSVLVADGLTHIAVCIDLANATQADRIKIFINGVKETLVNSTAPTDTTVDFTTGSVAIGKATNDTAQGDMELGQYYFAEELFDLDTAENLAKVYSSGAVDMGADASNVTGTQPLIYLNNTLSTWQNNLGSGGNFTETGALTAGTDIVSSLPSGLDSETAYYVVNKTANDLELSLTSGGATVAVTDNGTGTHSILAVTQATLTDQGDFDTGKATLSGTVDISGQPSDTDMTLIVQTKNTKDTKLHGQALQYT